MVSISGTVGDKVSFRTFFAIHAQYDVDVASYLQGHVADRAIEGTPVRKAKSTSVVGSMPQGLKK